jgi:hypothetical protein
VFHDCNFREEAEKIVPASRVEREAGSAEKPPQWYEIFSPDR